MSKSYSTTDTKVKWILKSSCGRKYKGRHDLITCKSIQYARTFESLCEVRRYLKDIQGSEMHRQFQWRITKAKQTTITTLTTDNEYYE